MPNLSLTEQEKIEAFCRELAQSLRQITGRQAAPAEEELASQVTARPLKPVPDKSSPDSKSQPVSDRDTNDASKAQDARATGETKKRAGSGARGKRSRKTR